MKIVFLKLFKAPVAISYD